MMVPCLDCGKPVPFSGDEILATVPALRRLIGRPAARCNLCYREWQEREAIEVRAEQRQYEVAVKQYLRKNQLPPPEILRELERGGFSDQWKACRAEWERRSAEEKAHGKSTRGRDEEVR